MYIYVYSVYNMMCIYIIMRMYMVSKVHEICSYTCICCTSIIHRIYYILHSTHIQPHYIYTQYIHTAYITTDIQNSECATLHYIYTNTPHIQTAYITCIYMHTLHTIRLLQVVIHTYIPADKVTGLSPTSKCVCDPLSGPPSC